MSLVYRNRYNGSHSKHLPEKGGCKNAGCLQKNSSTYLQCLLRLVEKIKYQGYEEGWWGLCCWGNERGTSRKVRSSESGGFCSQEHVFICPSSTGMLPGLGFAMHTLCQESAQVAYETTIDGPGLPCC